MPLAQGGYYYGPQHHHAMMMFDHRAYLYGAARPPEYALARGVGLQEAAGSAGSVAGAAIGVLMMKSSEPPMAVAPAAACAAAAAAAAPTMTSAPPAAGERARIARHARLKPISSRALPPAQVSLSGICRAWPPAK